MLGSIPSEATIDKAAKIVHAGRVHPAGTAAIYHVGGDSAIYRVVLLDGEETCTCPARGMCSHIGAAMLRHDQIGEDMAAAHAARRAA